MRYIQSALLLSIMMIMTACSGGNASSKVSDLNHPPTHMSDTELLEQNSTDREKSQKQLPQSVTLDYTAAKEAEVHVKQIKTDPSAEKLRLHENIIVYARESEGTALFLGQLQEDTIHELGEIGEEHYLPEISAAKDQVFGEEMNIVSGLCGANCMVNYIFSNTDDHMKMPIVVYGGLFITDLGEDGNHEVVTSSGTIAEKVIYKMVDGQIMSVQVNKALGITDSVGFDPETGTFEVYIENEKVQYQYIGEDQLVQVE
ncbi:hypothetical protein [Marinicrinis lubricantis]|uniref:Uncharacterized protein n=1 Tax=Marinicrinis lubricantis TaxID=2086470 RepID=A0ABW1IV32_9BACL